MNGFRCSAAILGGLFLAHAAVAGAAPRAAVPIAPSSTASHSILAPIGAFFTKDRFKNPPPLLRAILNDRPNTAKRLLEDGSPATARYKGVEPYIVIAAGLRPCNPEMLNLLIAHGADPNGKIINLPRGNSAFFVHLVPLMAAASGGSRACVATLLGHGANPNGFDITGDTVLAAAAASKYCSPDLITLLAKSGADPNFVSDPDDLPKYVVQSELKKFGNIPKAKKYELLLASIMFARWPPLVMAAAYDHPACARTLIDSGADVNVAAAPGDYTSLMGAVDRGKSVAITVLLLQAGADVHARTEKGLTALFMVVGENPKYAFPPYCLRCAELLIGAGADVNAVDDSGDTPLIFAAGAKDALPIMELLVSSGADVNYRNPKTGMTALLAARSAGNSKTVNYLKAKGAVIPH